MKVTIEGSATQPNTFLAAGRQATVERTPLVSKMIARGFVNEVYPEPKPTVLDPVPVQQTMAEVQAHASSQLTDRVFDQRTPLEREADEQAALARQGLDAPSKAASTATWREFLDGLEPPVEYPEDASRSKLIELWERRG